MGNYIDSTNLIQVLSEKEQSELTGDLNELETVESVSDWAIETSESIIDTYISSQVSVPMAVPSQIIKNMALQLSKYFLFLRRHNVPEDVQTEYNRTMKMLEKMLSGELPVDVTNVEETTIAYGGDSRLFNPHIGQI